ncbi:hypothetical protein ONZ45_g16553 [Pleurotus djamor]|nr:hypothetical protein ONZ45_g16553 [Pleurotus djamor]
MNSGLTAFTFFGVREAAVSPILRRFSPSDRDAISEHSTPRSWGELRSQKLLDSSLSGAITAGGLRGMKSGPRSVLPGAVTGAIICTLLQYTFNEVRVQRLKYLLRPQFIATNSPSAPEVETPFFDRILANIGMERIPDEKYLRMLKDRREKHLSRIRELEAEIAQQADKPQDS